MDENPDTAEEFKAAARQIAAALNTGAETTINIAGDQVKLRSKEEGGFAIASSDGSIVSDLFEPAESRPSGYPDDLPFIAGETVAFSSTDGSVSLIWWSVRDPAAVLSQLDLESRAQGYVLEDEQDILQMQMMHRQYTSGDRTRTIIAGGAMVILMEQRG